jgi:hypothetical protein
MRLKLFFFLFLLLVPTTATICQFLNHSFGYLYSIYCADPLGADDWSVCQATKRDPGYANYKQLTQEQKSLITGPLSRPHYRYYFVATCESRTKSVSGIEIYGLKLPLHNPDAMLVPVADNSTEQANATEMGFDLEPALRLLSSDDTQPVTRFVLGEMEQAIDFPNFNKQRFTIEVEIDGYVVPVYYLCLLLPTFCLSSLI